MYIDYIITILNCTLLNFAHVGDTIENSSEITISLSFTAEYAARCRCIRKPKRGFKWS